VRKVEVGITHEVTINGDKSWVRLSIQDEAETDTDLDVQLAFLSRKVNQELINIIEQTVETVNNYSNKEQ
jgi:hypothetical protein